MENKKYLEKVLNHLVKNTHVDYRLIDGKKFVENPYFSPLNIYINFYNYTNPNISPIFFERYCKNHFGLRTDEVDYLWNQYMPIIIKEIEILKKHILKSWKVRDI